MDADSGHEEPPPARCPALLEEVSDGGARVVVAHAYPVGAAVELLVGDELWLGEVVWRAEGCGGYAVGILVEQRMKRLTELESLCRSLLRGSGGGAGGGGLSAGGSAAPQPARQSASR